MPFAQLPEFVRTLRFRLTVWNTVVVLLVVVLTLWGVREGLRFTLRREADKQLQEDAQEIRLTVERSGVDLDTIYPELDRKAISHRNRGFFIRFFDDKHQSRWASQNAPEDTFPIELMKSGLKPVSAEKYRLVHLVLERRRVRGWTIRVGVSFEPLEADVAQLTRLMLAAGAVVLVISPLGGYWLAGRATRPLAQIIDTTARLSPGGLHERLTIRGTDDELDRLSKTINGFLDRIAAYIGQNREFTANAAHELRSPLTAIQSSLDVALYSDRSVGEYKDLLADLLDECTTLGVIVNQLLLLAEVDAGLYNSQTEPVQFDAVATKGFEMFQGVAETAGIDLRMVRLDPVVIDGDRVKFRQVINNLLDNAIKFTPPHGTIAVELTADRTTNLAMFRVADSGVGISPEDLPHICERFYLPDKSRNRENLRRGSGLGLSICKAIVEAYQGRLELHSVVDHGTTISVYLPISTKATAPRPPEFHRNRVPALPRRITAAAPPASPPSTGNPGVPAEPGAT